MVSVIIPVYKTEEYLVQCLDSVIGQTYGDIEIILVVGKGSDASLDICCEYEKRDDRIRILAQEGSGAGAARNQGVADARGEFICFVDSDDWIDTQFVEKMHNAIVSHDVEIVECDYRWGKTGNERVGGNSPYVRPDVDLLSTMGTPACWKQIYRKSMWDREGLEFTNTVAEDLFLYSDMYRICRGSFFLKEALYFYRVRSGSFSETAKRDTDKYRELITLFGMMTERYAKRGIFEKCGEELYRQVIPHACNRYRAIYSKVDGDTAKTLAQESDSFFVNAFNKKNNPFSLNVKVFGSYNLGRIGNLISASPINDMRYCFSSLASAFADSGVELKFNNDNPYRTCMIEKDIKKSFVRDFNSDVPDVLLLDFLDERYDLIRYSGCIFTGSDALKESWDEPDEYESISFLCDEHTKLWEVSCDRFIDMIRSSKNKCKVILVENYLSEYIGTIYNRTLKTDERIKRINSKLRDYYKFIESKCPEIEVIDADSIPDSLVYTEEGFEHGTVPEHMNSYYYGYIANRIMNNLE